MVSKKTVLSKLRPTLMAPIQVKMSTSDPEVYENFSQRAKRRTWFSLDTFICMLFIRLYGRRLRHSRPQSLSKLDVNILQSVFGVSGFTGCIDMNRISFKLQKTILINTNLLINEFIGYLYFKLLHILSIKFFKRFLLIRIFI